MRRYIRHPSDIPIEVELADVAAEGKDYLDNISLGGLCFRSRVELKTGQLIRVRIPLVRPVFEADGRVVWCNEQKDYYAVGVEFVKKSDLLRARMVEQVCYIEHYKAEIRKKEGRELTSEDAALEWIRQFASQFPQFGESDR